VGEEGDSRKRSSLLPALRSRRRREHCRKLARQRLALPQPTTLVKEGRDLRRHPAVPRRRAENETIDRLEVVRRQDGVFGREGSTGVHLVKHLFGESLSAGGVSQPSDGERIGLHEVRADLGAGGSDALDDLLGERADVAVGRVKGNGDNRLGGERPVCQHGP
jgi:hypothetical protein